MLVAVAAAKGAPGVTTTARVLAAVWPKEVVLADCDPAGGDLALLARSADGGVLDPDRGVLSLAAQARRGLAEDATHEHLQRIEGGLDVLCGVAGPEQMTGIGPAMPALAASLRSLPGRDVIADCGRVAPGSPVIPLLTTADAVVMVVRPRLEAYAHLRERLRWLLTLHDGQGRPPVVGVVVVTAPHDQRSATDLGKLLAHSGLAVPVIGRVADDPRAADVVAGRIERGIDRSLLVRSVRQLTVPVRELAAGRAGEY